MSAAWRLLKLHDLLGWVLGRLYLAERLADAHTALPNVVSCWLVFNADLHTLPQVSSAFSQLLNLHNLSEEISSAQLERAVRMGEARTPRR